MKIISTIRALFAPFATPFAAADDDRRRWLADPLSHPELDAMSPRELGDVPLRPVSLVRCEA